LVIATADQWRQCKSVVSLLLIRVDLRKSAVAICLSDSARYRRYPDVGDSCGPLPASVSQSPTRHLRFVANKSKSAFRPGDDRAVEALFPLFSAINLAVCHPLFLIGFAMSGRGSQKNDCTHPGVDVFVANKRRSAIQQPYDSLVEGNFFSRSGFVLADY
jgi:hypothetical protein